MTNNEKLNQVTHTHDTPEESAVKSLLTMIYDDVQNGDFIDNYGSYLLFYRGHLEWLKAEVSE